MKVGDGLEQTWLDIRQEVLARRCENSDDGVWVDFALYGNGRFDFEELIVSNRPGVVALAFSSSIFTSRNRGVASVESLEGI